jgi:hypothetical protein
MNKDHRSDRDVCQRRRRRGAYAAVLSAAAGAALAAAMIPAPLAYADTTDDAIGAAAAGDSVSDITSRTPESIANGDVIALDDDLGLKFLAGPENGLLDSIYASLPGGADGTLGIDAETTVANLATDGINLLDGGGGMRMLDAAAADAEPAAAKPPPITEEAVLNNHITTLFDDLHDPSGAGPDIQFTDFLLGLLPGGGNGTDGVEVEGLLVTDIYTPLIELVGGGGMMAF